MPLRIRICQCILTKDGNFFVGGCIWGDIPPVGSVWTAQTLAPCGACCATCSAHLSGKKPCPGCRAPAHTITRKSCRVCKKRACASEKGLTWCFECADFPCASIRAMSRRYVQAYEIDLIQNGLDARCDMDAFLRAQAEAFTCDACGGVMDQHVRACSVCGKNGAR